MDDESGESMEPMEEVPLKELGEAELERLVRGWRREAGSWFQRRGEAWKERSVIRIEDAYWTAGSKKARINNKVGSVVSDNTGLAKVVKVANPRRKTREAVQN